MRINVFVKGIDGTQRIINIEDTATLEEFKQQAEEVFGYDCIELVFGGQILSNDDKTLREHGVKNMSLVKIDVRRKNIINCYFRLNDNLKLKCFVDLCDGTRHYIDINSETIITELKQLIEERFEVSIVGIVCEGKILTDYSETLDVYCNKNYNGIFSLYFRKNTKSKIKVYIKGTDGVKRILEVYETDTFKEFEQQVKKDLNIIIKKAVFGGKIIEDKTKTLSEYEIKDKSLLQIIERLAGGQNDS